MRGAFAKYKVATTVTEAGLVTPSMRSIRLVADEEVPFAYRPGQHVRVELRDPLSVTGILRPGDTLRTYTIWEFGAAERSIELRAHLYDGEGPGRRWAASVRPGDRVTLWWPQNTFTLRDTTHHVFIGEESASGAFGPLIREVADPHRCSVLLESESPDHDPPLPAPADRIHRVHRHGSPATASDTLLKALGSYELPPAEHSMAYLAGEARTCQLLRTHLITDRGWPRTSITTKPFWTPAKRGLH